MEYKFPAITLHHQSRTVFIDKEVVSSFADGDSLEKVIGLENDLRLDLLQLAVAGHLDPEGFPDRAVSAIGSDQVTCPHQRLATVPGEQSSRHAGLVLLQSHELAAEAQAHIRHSFRFLSQQRFQVVLRHQLVRLQR